MIEWLFHEPNRAESVLGLAALVITLAIAWFGRHRAGLMFPLALVFLVLALILFPSAIPARSNTQRAVCVANLRRISNAKHGWAKKYGKSAGDMPTEADLCGTNAFICDFPQCPRGGTYVIRSLGEDPTCSCTNKGHKLNRIELKEETATVRLFPLPATTSRIASTIACLPTVCFCRSRL